METSTLQHSMLSLRENSEKLSRKLNGLSQEIKWLESELQKFGPAVEFTLRLRGRQELSPDERDLFVMRNIPGWDFLNASATERLHWRRDRSSGKFRIIYSRLIEEDRVATGHGSAQSGEITTVPFACDEMPDGVSLQRPLIECSSEVRTRVYNILPRFIEELNRAVSEEIGGGNV
jgi:hypothetical protein